MTGEILWQPIGALAHMGSYGPWTVIEIQCGFLIVGYDGTPICIMASTVQDETVQRAIAEVPAMVQAIRLQVSAADAGDADASMAAFDAFRATLARIDGED